MRATKKTKIVCAIGPASENEEILTRMCLAGMNARMISRFRSPVDILGITTNERTLHKLALSRSVLPAMSEEFISIDVLFYFAKQLAREKFGLQPGDKIVITGGIRNGHSGNTNLIKIEII